MISLSIREDKIDSMRLTSKKGPSRRDILFKAFKLFAPTVNIDNIIDIDIQDIEDLIFGTHKRGMLEVHWALEKYVDEKAIKELKHYCREVYSLYFN